MVGGLIEFILHLLHAFISLKIYHGSFENTKWNPDNREQVRKFILAAGQSQIQPKISFYCRSTVKLYCYSVIFSGLEQKFDIYIWNSNRFIDGIILS